MGKHCTQKGAKVQSRKKYDVSEEMQSTHCEWCLMSTDRERTGCRVENWAGARASGLMGKARKDSG